MENEIVLKEFINMFEDKDKEILVNAEFHLFNDEVETDYSKIKTKYPPKILHQSSIDLSQIPSGSVDLIVTSPVYNVGKKYAQNAQKDSVMNYIYLQMMKKIFTESFRVLTKGGKICVNIGNHGNKPFINLAAVTSMLLQDAGFELFGEIVWAKGQVGAGSGWGSWKNSSNPYIRGVHEYIILARKGNHSLKKPNPSSEVTLTKDGFLRSTLSIWYISPVGKSQHPAPFPVGIPHRLINLFTTTDMVVLDVFAGSGTTVDAAMELGRKSIGVDISKQYTDMMKKKFKVGDETMMVKEYGRKWLNWFSSLD